MSAYYVSSVDGNDNGLVSQTWWNGSRVTYATLAAACAVASSTGDIIYVDSAHNETGATTINAATNGQGLIIKCKNRSTGADTTGAVVSNTTNGQTVAVGSTNSFSQHLRVKGVAFKAPSGNSSGNNVRVGYGTASPTMSVSVILENCELWTQGNNTVFAYLGAANSAAPAAPRVRLVGCTIYLPNRTSSTPAIQFGAGQFEIENLTVSASANQPSVLFGFALNACGIVKITGDISGYTVSGGSYWKPDTIYGTVRMENCKLHGTPSKVGSATWANESASVTWINCDSADTRINYEYYAPQGTVLLSTSVYANDGVTFDGVHCSWQIVTTSLCEEARPFRVPLPQKWNASTSSQTATVEILNFQSETYNDLNCWLEFNPVGDASYPLGTLASSRNASPYDGSASNLASGSATWTDPGGLGTQTKQKLSKAFTAAEKSLLSPVLCIGIGSKTLYVDAKLRLA